MSINIIVRSRITGTLDENEQKGLDKINNTYWAILYAQTYWKTIYFYPNAII